MECKNTSVSEMRCSHWNNRRTVRKDIEVRGRMVVS